MDEFLKAAVVPREGWHAGGTLQEAERLLVADPALRRSGIYVAAVLGDEAGVRAALAADAGLAAAKGGPYGWDALTYLCFSRYLRLQKEREEEFVRTARVLLEAGADADTGWYESTTYDGVAKQEFESVLYGAAGVARSGGMTRLLLESGADPNDEETPYHVPEGYDNTVMQLLLESGRLTPASKTVMLVRKADWHDLEGLRLVLEHGGDPNLMGWIKFSGLQHAIRRDNSVEAIELLLDHGADPALANARDGRSGTAMAARQGRGDLLELFVRRGFALGLEGVERLIARCALGDAAEAMGLVAAEPELRTQIRAEGGALLADFAGNGNLAGVRCLLDLGVPVNHRFVLADGYLGIARETTPLHVAAWRGWPAVVKELIARGADVGARDGSGTFVMALAVKATVASYWTGRRSPESVKALLAAGATLDGVAYPCGYDEVDAVLAAAGASV